MAERFDEGWRSGDGWARSVRIPGTFHLLAGAHPGPRPQHDPGIWLGAKGPRMLTLTGQRADGCALRGLGPAGVPDRSE